MDEKLATGASAKRFERRIESEAAPSSWGRLIRHPVGIIAMAQFKIL